LIDTDNVELTAERFNETTRVELFSGEVVVSHILKTRLSHLEVTRQSLSFHQKGKVIATIVRVVHLSDFNGVISKEIVDNEGKFIKTGKEAENFAVVIKELLLALDSATTEGLFHIFLKAWVSELFLRDLFLGEAVIRNSLRLSLRMSLSL
jgi:hypothetical protein